MHGVGRTSINEAWIYRALCSTLLVLSAPQSAAAQIPSVGYEAPPQCPKLEVFASALAGRSAGPSSHEVGEPSLRVRIASSAEGFHGSVELRGSAQASEPRELSSSRCDDLVQALALAAAVLLTPVDAEIDPSEDTVARSVSPPVTAAAASAAGPERPAAESPRAPSGTQSAAHASRLRARTRLGLSLEHGALPRTSLSPRLGLAGVLSLTRNSQLELGLSAGLPLRQSTAVDGSSARFELWAVRSEACLGVRLSDRVELVPCAVGELGQLRAIGLLTPQQVDRRAWWAFGGSVAGRAELTRHLGIYTDFGVLRPLTRPHYYFAQPAAPTQGVAVHRVAASTLSAELGFYFQFQ